MFAPVPRPLRALVGQLGDVEPEAEDSGMIEQLDALERIKAAAAAAQARITATFEDLRTGRSEASTGAEIGLARHESPHRGRSALHLARALVHDLPHTLAALEAGDINEHRAQIIATGTHDLDPHDRSAVDADLAQSLPCLGDRDLADEVARRVMRTDPHGATRRREAAHTRRHLTTRRLGDGMAQVSATVSDVDASAIIMSLHERADIETATGVAEGRTHSQLLVDLFVERLTGRTMAIAAPIALSVVISAEALLGEGDEPAEIPGHGPIPASVARNLVLATEPEDLTIRRLFRLDDTDRLIAMDSTARTYNGLLAQFIRLRDRRCRTPWCNAPIRHLDHTAPVHAGGQTTELNAQALCVACNQTKEQPGWSHHPPDDPHAPHRVEITTPTGHHHVSTAPAAPAAPAGQHWIARQPGVWTLTA